MMTLPMCTVPFRLRLAIDGLVDAQPTRDLELLVAAGSDDDSRALQRGKLWCE
jgi:hypothetical protein